MRHKQHGWTLWSLLAVCALITVFALLIMKLGPVYFDNHKLKEALASVAGDPRAAAWNKNQFIKELDNRLYIDYGHEIVSLKDTLSVEKKKTGTVVTIEYEIVVPLVHNLSALMDFRNQEEISR